MTRRDSDRPTLLGRMLRYTANAMRYALAENRAGKATGRGASLFTAPVQSIADAGKYATGESNVAIYKAAIVSSWIYSDIKLLADRVASSDATIAVKQRTSDQGLEDINNHPGEILLARPNGVMSGGFLLRYMTWWYLLAGQAYALITSTGGAGKGEPVEIWPLPGDMMKPLPATKRAGALGFEVIDYAFISQGRETLLPGENVLHWRTPNPFDYWQGLSPLNAAMIPMETDAASLRWMRDFYRKDNAVPTALVSFNANVLDSDFDAMVEEIKAQIEAGRRILFTREGDFQLQTIQQTIADMRLLDGRSFTRDEIDRIYGIPPYNSAVSGDSQLAWEIRLARNAVQPLLASLCDELTAKLAPFYGEGIVFEPPNIVPQDRALELQEYNAYAADRTINENRQERGLDPLKKKGKPEVCLWDDIPARVLAMLPPEKMTGWLEDTLGIEPEEKEEPTLGAIPPQLAAFQAGQEPAQQEPQPAANLQAPGQEPPEPVEGEPPMIEKAAALGVATELKRWEKVALAEMKARRNPADKPFVSEVLPQALQDAVRTALGYARSEAAVKAAFEAAHE